MAYTKKTASAEQDTPKVVEKEPVTYPDTATDVSADDSRIWTTLESGKNKTFVMNVSTGCIIRTESSNGSTMCYIPNTRYSRADGFKRIN